MKTITSIGLCSTVVLMVLGTGRAPAQLDDRCSGYARVVKGGILKRELIANWTEALSCLVRVVDEIAGDVNSVEAAQDRRDLLQSSIAIRAILEENKDPAVQLFQATMRQIGEGHSTKIISVFSFAARSQNSSDLRANENNHDLRVNTTPILARVVDNSTICVPIDHLYDSKIAPAGRVNLLAVVTYFVPRTNKENVENIKTLIKYSKEVAGAQALEILDGLQAKTNSAAPVAQTGIPSDLAACKAYQPHWAGNRLGY